MNSPVVIKEFMLLDYVATRFRRSKLKWAGFFILFTLVTFFYGSLFFFSDLLTENSQRWLGSSPDLVVQMQRSGRQRDIALDLIPVIAKIRGVASVTPRYWGYYYDPATRCAYTVIGAEKGENGTAIIGDGIARLWKFGEGDTLSLQDEKGDSMIFHIAKVFPRKSDLVTTDLFQISQDDFHTLFHLPQDEATDLAVRVPREEERATVAAKIKKLYPACRIVVKGDLSDTLSMIFGWRSAIFLIISLVGLFALLIFVVDQFSGLWSGERKETALLRTLGWPTTLILRARLYEVFIVTITAWLLGTILAWLHVCCFSGGFLAAALRGWSSLFPKWGFQPIMHFSSVALLFTLTVIPLLTVSLIPIWKQANIDPEEMK